MDIKQTISEILMESGIYASMYDLVRVVDAPKGRLLELKDRIVTETVTNCTDALCSSARCKNCTSIRAYYTGETSVKFEYVSGAVMLVMSVPVTLNDEKFVVELIKDITSSMTIDIEDANKSRSMEFAIARLNSMAQTDALTSLPNRQFINDKLPENIKSCLNNGDSLSVVLVDIDFFKRINDTYGHLCGDEILREIAKVLKGSLRRKSDWAARYGGEEFLICFPGATTDVAYRIAEQMREDIQNRTYHFEGNELKVTISCGVSEMTGDDNLFEIISRADKLLYRAKQEGRNRVLYDNASQPQFMR